MTPSQSPETLPLTSEEIAALPAKLKLYPATEHAKVIQSVLDSHEVLRSTVTAKDERIRELERERNELRQKYSQNNIASSVSKWLQVKGEGYDVRRLSPDLSHSALFQRFLEGKPFLSKVPPKAFSYPWYSLIEEGKAEAEIWFQEDDSPVINQNSAWKLKERISKKEAIVTFEDWLDCRILKTRPGKGFFEWDVEVIEIRAEASQS